MFLEVVSSQSAEMEAFTLACWGGYGDCYATPLCEQLLCRISKYIINFTSVCKPPHCSSVPKSSFSGFLLNLNVASTSCLPVFLVFSFYVAL